MPKSDLSITALICLALLSCVLFTTWPGIDLAVSALFWNGSSFPFAKGQLVQGVRYGMWYLSVATALLALVCLVGTQLTRNTVLRLPARSWGFIFGLYLLGPGILVNLLLKSHWGRARPHHVEAFGGDRIFTPALWPTDQCASNCSFVSGEAAAAIALAISLLFFASHFRSRVSWPLVVLAVALTVTGGGLRLVAGRHFLSDIVFAWLIVGAVALLLKRLILQSGTVTIWLEKARLSVGSRAMVLAGANVDTPGDSSYTPAIPNPGRDRDEGSERLKWS